MCDLLSRVSQRELELMYVASAMTDRSGNFVKMANGWKVSTVKVEDFDAALACAPGR